MADSKKLRFSKLPILKILCQNFRDFCVYRINSGEEHGCGSTYMAARLSERRPCHSKKCIFGLFCYKEVFFRTAWQAYGLRHIYILCINLSYKSNNQSLKFWPKNIKNWWFWKSQFFESAIFILFFRNFYFCFIPIKIMHKLWCRMAGTQFSW